MLALLMALGEYRILSSTIPDVKATIPGLLPGREIIDTRFKKG
jgi:hypothetical protein